MQKSSFDSIWQNPQKRLLLLGGLLMIISCFLTGLSSPFGKGTWLTVPNYGFLFLIAGIAVLVSTFLPEPIDYYVALAGVGSGSFLVVINYITELTQYIDAGASLQMGFYGYILGAALTAYAVYWKFQIANNKQPVKLKSPLIKEAQPKASVTSPAPPASEAARFCPQCGHPNALTANYCTKCGTKL